MAQPEQQQEEEKQQEEDELGSLDDHRGDPHQHDEQHERDDTERTPVTLNALQLVEEIRIETASLLCKQIELARAQLRDELRADAAALRSPGLGVGGIGAIIAVTLLLVAAILALGTVVPAWEAALAVCAVVLLASAIGALVDWNLRTRAHCQSGDEAEDRDRLQGDLRCTKKRLS